MKRKLYLSILAVLLPSIIYFIIFFINDPHGYFSGKGDEASTLMENMLEWKHGDYDALMLGDSRMTRFNKKYITKLNDYSGYTFMNMAYDGSMGTETNSLIRWCISQKPGKIKSIIIVTGWYNYGTLLQKNRVISTEKIIESPFSYAFSIDNLQDMVSQLLPSRSQAPEQQTITAEEKEAHLITEMGVMSKYLIEHETSQKVLDEFIDVLCFCKSYNIQVRIITPPWIDRFYKELPQYGDYDMDEYKRKLSIYVDIYDMEYDGCELNTHFDDFSDYSHFYGDTFDLVADVLIYGDKEYSRLWRNGIVVK